MTMNTWATGLIEISSKQLIKYLMKVDHSNSDVSMIHHILYSGED